MRNGISSLGVDAKARFSRSAPRPRRCRLAARTHRGGARRRRRREGRRRRGCAEGGAAIDALHDSAAQSTSAMASAAAEHHAAVAQAGEAQKQPPTPPSRRRALVDSSAQQDRGRRRGGQSRRTRSSRALCRSRSPPSRTWTRRSAHSPTPWTRMPPTRRALRALEAAQEERAPPPRDVASAVQAALAAAHEAQARAHANAVSKIVASRRARRQPARRVEVVEDIAAAATPSVHCTRRPRRRRRPRNFPSQNCRAAAARAPRHQGFGRGGARCRGRGQRGGPSFRGPRSARRRGTHLPPSRPARRARPNDGAPRFAQATLTMSKEHADSAEALSRGVGAPRH